MDGLQFFRLHYQSYRPWTERLLLTDLTEDQLRARPAGTNISIAWTLWHTARSEDLLVNPLVAGQPQVLDREGWVARLGVPLRRMGTGMSDAETGDFSATVDLTALRAYWHAVGEGTLAVTEVLRPEDLDTVPGEAYVRAALLEVEAMGDDVTRLEGALVPLYADKSRGWFLSHALTHAYSHFGELSVLRGLLGLRGLDLRGGVAQQTDSAHG
jgi:hypothetical protein